MTTITQENIKFNGTLDNAAVLDEALTAGGVVRTMIAVDDLSAADRAQLDAFVAKCGSNPLTAATAGNLTANFPTGTTVLTATGLVATATATSGSLIVDIGGDKTAVRESGLSTLGVLTSGHQTIILAAETTGATLTGFANDASVYAMTVTIDGTAIPVSVVGSTAQTVAELVALLVTAVGAAGTVDVELVENSIEVTSATTGSQSTVSISGGTLLPALTPFSTLEPAVRGDSTGRMYAAVFTIDGTKQRSVRFSGVSGELLSDVVDQINAALTPDATASLDDGNLVVTSTGTGLASTVTAQDTGSLFVSLTGYSKISSTTGASPRVYSMFVEVDGETIPVSFQGSAAQTFADLAAEVDVDLDTAATATLVGGDIVITSATTGLSSTVHIVHDDLFKYVTGFAGSSSVAGATNLVDAMKAERVGSASLFDLFNVVVVGEKPARPPVPLVIPKVPEFTYFGGTPASWRYLHDDAVINP